MQYRTIGSLKVSVAGLGCGNFGFFIDERQSREVVAAAIDQGVTHFDTADVYGEGLSEQFLGKALGRRRENVVITTKFGASTAPDGLRPGSAAWTKRACEASLARLGTDWIDLYLFHQPDPGTPIVETLEALTELRAAGKIREIGCSNFSATQIRKAAEAAERLGVPGFRTVQNSYSLLDRTPELKLLPVLGSLEINLLPYLPLASGMLTGKYRRGEDIAGGRLGYSLRGAPVRDYFPALLTDEAFDVVEALEDYARAHEHSLVELALSWLASKAHVAGIIAGATSPEQVRRNVEALSSWRLTATEQKEVEQITCKDVCFTWNAGFPSDTPVPDCARNARVLDVRKQDADISLSAGRIKI